MNQQPMNFHVKIGTIVYKGCLIHGTGTGYRWGKEERATFGEIVLLIQEACEGLAKSIKTA